MLYKKITKQKLDNGEDIFMMSVFDRKTSRPIDHIIDDIAVDIQDMYLNLTLLMNYNPTEVIKA